MQIDDFKSEMWTIMYQVKAGMQKFIEPILQAEGLNMFQTYILIGLSEGTISTMSSICKEIGINQGNVSTMCKQMEKEGLIKRCRSTEDERVVTLSLTDQGNQKLQSLHAKEQELNTVFEQIPKEKLEAIINGMNAFNDLLKTLSTKN